MSAAWLRVPDQIYARSFAIIRAEAELDRLPPALVPLALRVVHACGMVEVAANLAWQGDPAAAGRAALAAGRHVVEHIVGVGLGTDQSLELLAHRQLAGQAQLEAPDALEVEMFFRQGA